MADISKIEIENTVYNVKDVTARQQIQNLQSINHVLIIGDSWSTPQQDLTKWFNIIGNDLNLTIDNFAVSGAGFYHNDVPNTTFAEQIALASQTVSPSTLKYIIVYGGVNDYRNGVSAENFAVGFNNVVTNARTYFPNAELIILPLNIGYSNNAIYNGFSKYRTNCLHNCLPSHSGFCQTVSFWLMPYGTAIWQELSGELLHPNATGHQIIASYIESILNGTYDGVHNEVRYGTGQSPNDDNIRVLFNNGLLSICGGTNQITGTTGSISIGGGLNTFLFGTFPTNLFGTGIAVDGSDIYAIFCYIGQDGNLSIEGRVDLTGKFIVINSTFNS